MENKREKEMRLKIYIYVNKYIFKEIIWLSRKSKFYIIRVLERKIRNKEQNGLSTHYFKIDRYVSELKNIQSI